MPINLSGSLVLTGSITATGGITMSGSIASASYALSSSYAVNADLLDNRDSSTFANTGSNTFDGGQYLSSSFNPTGFSTTASLYTDGGLRVTRDAYISGTLYLNNVTVYGTQSVCFITSSQLNIGSNIISVNTSTPSVRFGGLAVYDSGSTGLTGSILWDSQDNQWIYSNPSGSEYDSSVFLVGPRSTGAIGNEQGINCNYLVQGHGLHHTTSSAIFHNGTNTCIPNTLIGSTICGSTSTFSSTSTACNFVTSGNTLFGITLKGRVSDNFGAIGFYSSDGGTRYGYVQSGCVFGGQVNMTGDGGVSITLDNRGFNAAGIATFSCRVCAPNINLSNSISINACSTVTVADWYNTNTDDGNGLYIKAGGVNSGKYVMALESAAGCPRMIVLANGNVGIGVTSPLAKLHVAGTIYSNVRCNTIDTDDGISNNFQGYGGYWALRTDESNRFNLDVYNSGTPVTALQLSLAGAACFSSTIQATGATIASDIVGDPVYLRVRNNNTGGYPSSLALSLYGYSGTAAYFDALRIQASYPGYGSANFFVKYQSTSTEVLALTLRGDGYMFSVPTYNNTWPGSSANMYVASDGSFGRVTASSRRFKENIIDWSGNGLDTILALKPKTFKYKKDYVNSDLNFLGLIAEEVAEVLPYLAEYKNPDRTGLVENVRYDTIVVPLISAIQEQQCTICSQASMINTLKTCLGII